MDELKAALWIAAAAMIGFGVGALLVWIKMRLRWNSEIDAARKQSVNQSRSTLKGQIGEQLAPLLPGFNYAASDARFLGDPIDYVVFDGYTELRDGQNNADGVEVVILDIKRGASRLSASQRAVADAVAAGRVRFEVIRIADSGEVRREEYCVQRRR